MKTINRRFVKRGNELILIEYSLSEYIKALKEALIDGKKSLLIRGKTELSLEFVKAATQLEKDYSFDLFYHDTKEESPPLGTKKYHPQSKIDCVFIFIVDSLSQVINDFDKFKGLVCIAPNNNAFCKTTVISIPKCGSYMLINTLTSFGYQGLGDIKNQRNKQFYFLDDDTCHLTFNRFKTLGGDYMHFFHMNPSLFAYRDPRDQLISYFHYIKRFKEFGPLKYIERGKNEEEQFSLLLKLMTEIDIAIVNPAEYVQWLVYKDMNLLPIKFEDLIGPSGGGSEEKQLAALWRMQLRLQVPGKTESFAKKVYNNATPTFHKGEIGAYKDFFQPIHYELFEKYNKKFGDLLKQYHYKD